MRKNKFIIICIVLLLAGCHSTTDFDSHLKFKLKKIGYEDDSMKKLTSIIILPGAGCTSCISETENYFKHNLYSHPKTLLILTAFSSKKSIEINFNQDLTNTETVFVDSDNLFNSDIFLSLYPLFIYLENGEVVKHEYAQPENPNAFSNYLDSINESL